MLSRLGGWQWLVVLSLLSGSGCTPVPPESVDAAMEPAPSRDVYGHPDLNGI